jgi:hypothetical protein
MDHIDLFARTDSLTDLALELYDLGELDDESRAKVEAHLATNAADAARLDELRALGAEFAALPLPAFVKDAEAPAIPSMEATSGDVSVPAPANRTWSWSSLAMAAVALLVVGVAIVGDDGPNRGVGAAVGVDVTTSQQDQVVLDLTSSEAGHWMVVHMSQAGGPRVVHPDSGRSMRLPENPGSLTISLERVDVEDADRLVAVRCEDAFSVGDLTPQLLGASDDAVEDAGCVAVPFETQGH